MNDQITNLQNLLLRGLQQIQTQRGIEVELDMPEIQRPKDESHGDLASNCAMKYAKAFGMPPRELAQCLASVLQGDQQIQSVEVAGPGFLNFRMSDNWMDQLVCQILEEKELWGRVDLGKGKKVQVEFVSANPTGPLHVGHGRGAAVGDVVGNILRFTGWDVQKEYYVNDAGLQMKILGRSIQSRYFEKLGYPEKAPFPEESYKGAYIYDVAQLAIDQKGGSLIDLPLDESLPYFSELGARTILDMIRNDLDKFGVRFDQFFSEKSLYENKLVDRAVNILEEKGRIYEHDGARWFDSSKSGDDKDRVLFRSNGVPTYFASDIAYHQNKFDRGFDRVIDVWGSDHHGYIPRLSAAIDALGKNKDQFNVLLIQFVNLLIEGKPVSMSTRAGTFETLEDVVKEVGVDATRYYFLMRRCDSAVEFDMAQAKRESTDNPVYYTQYAHARACSLLAKAQQKGVDVGTIQYDSSHSVSVEEKRLLAKIADFPKEIVRASENLEPHRLVTYLYELAGEFHAFYNACHILDEEGPVRDSLLSVVVVAQQTLKNCFTLLGITAPEHM